MKNPIFWPALLLITSLYTWAQPSPVVRTSNTLFTPKFRLKPTTETLECGRIAEEICDATWDKEHQGFIRLKMGDIKAGDLPDSDVRYVTKADLEALVASEPRLPRPLQKVMRPHLQKLKKLLQAPHYDDKWARQVGVVRFQYENAITDLAYDLAEKKYKGLRKIKLDKRTFDQNREVWSHYFDLKNQLLEAKYKNHPNWLRVEEVFSEVKNDILGQLRQLPIDDAFKSAIIEKVQNAQLMLPYSDPRKISSGDNCDETEMNAFYIPSRNAFTVCAGYFNGYPNEGTLYKVVAHELSHALDPQNLTETRARNESVVVKNLEALTHDIESVSCDTWNSMIETRRKNKSDMSIAIKPQLESLVSCLGDFKKLTPWDAAEARSTAKSTARSAAGGSADANVYLEMVQPFIIEDGVKRPNEYFLRPDLAFLRSHRYVGTSANVLGSRMNFIMVKNLKCSPRFKGLYEDLKAGTKEISNEDFRDLIEDSTEVYRYEREDLLRYNGQVGAVMARHRMSFDTDELFADWLAFRTMRAKLARLEDINDRREFAFLSVASACSKPSLNTTARELSAVQKEFSLEPHPERSARLRSVFTKAISEKLNCKPPVKISNVGVCDIAPAPN